jgi:GTP-binding protein EngB required for normal cell division
MKEKYLVFAGRPNAGKSSLIRALTGMNIVIGKHPGTTRKVSRYPLNEGLVLVDLPGLGKMVGVSKSFENMVNDQIVDFLESNSKEIVLAVVVLDISTFREVTRRLEKKGYMSIDVEMVKFLATITSEFPLVVANKIDKGNKQEIAINFNDLIARVSDGESPVVENNIFATSMKTGKGLSELKSKIHEKLVAKGYRTPFKIQT